MRRFSLVWRIADKYRLGPTQLEELLQLVLANAAGLSRAALRLRVWNRNLAASVDPSGDSPDFPQVPPAVTPRDGLSIEALVARHMVRSQAILDRLQTSITTVAAAMAENGGGSAEALQIVVERLNKAIEQGRTEATSVERTALAAPPQLAIALVGRPEAGCEELADLVAPAKLQVESVPEEHVGFSPDVLAADIICLAVGTDASPPDELAPLAQLLQQDKPVVVLLIHKENLSVQTRRERFVAEPDRWRTAPDSACQYFTDYLCRYCREQHLARPLLMPIHLNAALLAACESDATLAEQLRRGSNLDEFVAALRTWSIAERQIRRLANLLKRGTGVLCRQIDALYGELQLMKTARSDLHIKMRELSGNVCTAHQLACAQFDLDMTQLEWNMQSAVASFAAAHPQYDARRLGGALTALINERGYSRQAVTTAMAYEGSLRSAITGYVTDLSAKRALWVPPPSLPRSELESTINTRILSTALKLLPLPDWVTKWVDLIHTVNDEAKHQTDQPANWLRAQVSGMVAGWRKKGLGQLNQLREHVKRDCTATLHQLSQHLGLLAEKVSDEKGRLEAEERALCAAVMQQLIVSLVPPNRPAPVVLGAHRIGPRQLALETKSPLSEPVAARLHDLLMLELQFR